VEKSYFDSKVLHPANLGGLVDLGLEQARDTRPPMIEVRERFRPFVEDELDGWAAGSVRLTPHPPARVPVPRVVADRRVTLAIGPDGGWVPFEVDLLERVGFTPVSFGARVLRVEVAVSHVLGRVR
jgi:RsmE family RNA methyltransferase